jgi:tripartite-type tricarboxylate transporter receptor subunit TctC
MGAALLALCAAGGMLHAQDFPVKPITIVVPYSAGGSTDVSARTLGAEMSKSLGVSVIVENKPGAGGFVAATYVVKAPKDGYTLLFANGTITATNPSLYRNLPYKVADLVAISAVSKLAYVLNGNSAIPVTTVAEMIAYAKAKPEGVTIGCVGTGTQTHIVAEWLGRVFGIKVTPVQYKGTAQSSIDLMGGRLDFTLDALSTSVPMHASGKARIVASMGQERPGVLPAGVQTFEEAGYPALLSYAEMGLMAPVGTPAPAIRRLHAAVAAALKSPAIVDAMQTRGEVPTPSTNPEEYAAFIRSETVRWAGIIKPMNLQMD